jgi:hypothetical protein
VILSIPALTCRFLPTSLSLADGKSNNPLIIINSILCRSLFLWVFVVLVAGRIAKGKIDVIDSSFVGQEIEAVDEIERGEFVGDVRIGVGQETTKLVDA